jgi:hypothetical protein
MCLACEQDSIWLAYLESRGLLETDDPAAVEALFAAFPVQPLPLQPADGKTPENVPAQQPEKQQPNNPFACDDPTTG